MAMGVLVGMLMGGGFVAVVAAWVWLVVLAFKEDVWWGIGSLVLVPIVIRFGLTRWDKAWVPVVLFHAGLLASITGAVVGAVSR
jgi:hypothetical protein